MIFKTLKNPLKGKIYWAVEKQMERMTDDTGKVYWRTSEKYEAKDAEIVFWDASEDEWKSLRPWHTSDDPVRIIGYGAQSVDNLEDWLFASLPPAPSTQVGVKE